LGLNLFQTIRRTNSTVFIDPARVFLAQAA
jgi:hypothetical protein